MFLPVLLARNGVGLLPFTLPAEPLQTIAAFTGPTLAAFIVTAATSGAAGLRQLLRRIGQWRVGAGWYLLALRQFHAELFEHIEWSTPRVCAQTLANAQKLGLAVPDAHPLPRLYSDQPVARIDTMLFQFRPYERQRQRCAVYRPIDQRPYIWHTADVILVSMRQHQRRWARRALLQIRKIGNQQINTRQLGTGEHYARVDHDRCLVGRYGHQVHAELTESAKRHNL